MTRMINSGTDKPLSLGKQGEAWAQEYYRKNGFTVLASNVFNRWGKQLGEVDFIAKNSSSLIFVEVKTRSNSVGRFGTGADSVNVFKQRKLLKTVKLFLVRNPQYQSLRPQIDVCVITMIDLDKHAHSVTIIPNALEDWN